MALPVTRARTLADVDRDLTRHAWLLELAVSRYDMDATEAEQQRIDGLLEERHALQQQP